MLQNITIEFNFKEVTLISRLEGTKRLTIQRSRKIKFQYICITIENPRNLNEIMKNFIMNIKLGCLPRMILNVLKTFISQISDPFLSPFMNRDMQVTINYYENIQ